MDTRALSTLIPRLLIRAYQIFSSAFPRRCRFAPSCSHYALESLEQKGLIKGLWFAVLRILRCHPWNPGGYDPVSGARF